MNDQPTTGGALSNDEVRKVAKLSRLELSDAEITESVDRLASVLGYVDQLRELDVDGVKPMAHPSDDSNRLDADEPRVGLPTSVLTTMAPASEGDFVKAPKVIDGGGGA